MRWLRSLAPWALLAATLVGLYLGATPPAHRRTILDAASLLGILLLALPAIRVNEQGRLIDQVRRLQIGIREIERHLSARTGLDADVRRRQEETLRQRKASLETILDELTTGKGAWTPWVHRALYGGYVLLFGAAVARVLS